VGVIRFDGRGPYDLPVLQSSKAESVGNTVEVRIRLLATPSRLETVVLPMLPNQATELANSLLDAAQKALQWQKAHNPTKS